MFCQVTEAAANISNMLFKHHQITASTLVYVENFLIVADNFAALVTAFRIMDVEAGLLGLEFNPQNDAGLESPQAQIQFLEMTVRADLGDIVLPENKKIKYQAHLTEFVLEFEHQPAIPRKPVEKLVGELSCKVYAFWLSLFAKYFWCFVWPCWRCIALTSHANLLILGRACFLVTSFTDSKCPIWRHHARNALPSNFGANSAWWSFANVDWC